MKNLLLIIIFLGFSISSFSQKENLKLKNIKNKYANIFFKSPNKYDNKEQPFMVSKIIYSTSFKESESKNKYQISIYGKVSNNKEQILFNAKNIQELSYYRKVFKGKYKKILVFNYGYYKGKKKYYDTSLSVEY
ncbi:MULTISPECIES: hypothetical protein [unclassified Tenacibaculum]|uniref:hypothetical protein n=1 Tax=unclassified Tenacibaculum TaxID=2635139 RepID=UPI001F3159CE|nr:MULTISPECIES: hypothetical protein [unclassified Tenacibaculum]MCF2874244.1 hypothetical protein [Tenacibaculum sp. Cn5-1]MCF2934825.1 hypothetical protein [Tenacibaculum sp. Cn5-34]MCG7511035.1 hypothetical protein [Tenacibaculum sp. Cn5-46]